MAKKKEDIFNLQIPISLDLEIKLRKLAEEDDRKLRTYCRRLLQAHVDKFDMKLTDTELDEFKRKEKKIIPKYTQKVESVEIVNQNNEVEILHGNMEGNTEQPKKKKKVAPLNKK